MNKARIISALILFAVLGGFGAVYQFYLAEKLQKYRDDEAVRDQLEAAFVNLQNTFSGIQPEVLVAAWRAEVQPWTATLQARSTRFDANDWYEIELYPEDGRQIVKFWFDEQVNEQFTDLYQKVRETPGLYRFPSPQQVRSSLGIPTLSDLENMNLSQQDAYRNLRRLSFFRSVAELILDSRVSAINNLIIWPRRQVQEHNQLLNLQSIGLDINMTARDFVSFVDNQLRTADRHFTVEGMQVSYPYIAYRDEPQLRIQMIMTRAQYLQRSDNQGGGGGGGGGRGSQASAGGESAVDLFALSQLRREREAENEAEAEPGPIGKAWKWFKRVVLVTN